jgi:hypothetical protein
MRGGQTPSSGEDSADGQNSLTSFTIFLSVVRQVVRFYSHVICPLCETKRCSRQAAALGLVLAFVLVVRTEAVVGAVGKWESRAFCEIPKGVWEPVGTAFWEAVTQTV